MSDAVDARAVLEIVGPLLMRELCEQFGGHRVYIPHTVPDRADAIAQEFERVIPAAGSVGLAYQTVADTHECSARTVRRIISSR